MTAYDHNFFADIGQGAKQSARVLLPVVFDAIRPKSVVDVGCGTGNWLAVCAELGIRDFQGIDGHYVDRSQLAIASSQFVAADLEGGIEVTRRFDLAVCLEVAEHLSEKAGLRLVRALANLAPAVLFSAAIPGQGGTDHVNERWPDYWAAEFARVGLRAFDVVRPAEWDNTSVDWWYRQNAMLYLSDAYVAAHPELGRDLATPRGGAAPLSFVHPALFEAVRRQAAAPVGVRRAARDLVIGLRERLGRRR